MLRPSQGLSLEMPQHFGQLSRELPAAQLNLGPTNKGCENNWTTRQLN